MEILITMGVASVVGILIIQVFFSTTRSNTKTELLKDVKQNGEYAIGVIERMVRSAQDISTVCSEGGTTVSQLTIVNPDLNTTTFGCLLDGTVTRIASQSGTGEIGYLTGSNVTVGGLDCADVNSSLQFVCTTYSGGQSKVSVSFTLTKAGNQVDQTDQASALFKTTVVTRN